ncbi:MAG: choice-of-anchor Q domain-containing protein, partial [Chloroflexota bacterium]
TDSNPGNNSATDSGVTVTGFNLIVDRTDDDNSAAAQVCSAAANDCSLRGAISKANADTANDYILTVPAGTYTLLLSGTDDTNDMGDLDITDNLIINGAGSVSTIIDANTIDRVFEVRPNVLTEFNDVTITQGNEGTGSGGGILVNSSSVATVTNSRLMNNTAQSGGGIYAFGIGATAIVINSSIQGNMAVSSGSGGGLGTNSGNLTIINSTITNNQATGGAGSGGGISQVGGVGEVRNSTIFSNSATFGGAIDHSSTGQLTVLNSTLSGNSSTIATFHTNGSTSHIINTTIVSNTAGSEAVLAFGGSTIIITNTIVAQQITGGDCTNTGSTLTSGGYNIESGTSCGFANTGDQQSVTPVALDIGPLQNNGGTTDTHALLSGGSAAVGQIPPGTNGCNTTITEDQRGTARPQGANCDVGAFELVGGS